MKSFEHKSESAGSFVKRDNFFPCGMCPYESSCDESCETLKEEDEKERKENGSHKLRHQHNKRNVDKQKKC